MWDYTDNVMDHFLKPRNVGKIEDADGIGEVGSLACGDALTLTFKLDDNGRIADARFQTFGCASAVASSSVLTEIIKGMTLDEAMKVTNDDIIEKLGGLPDQKIHCSVMGQEALEAAIENYSRKGKGGTSPSIKEGRIICKCFGITEDEIRKVVSEHSLTSAEEVTNYCKAGGGCGGCTAEIEEVISEVQGQKLEAQKPAPQRPVNLTNIQKIQLIQQTITEQIRPTLRADGGDIDLIDVVGNKVIVAFRGMCAQCHMAEFTMSQVVEAKLKEFVSEDIVVEEETDKS